MDTNPDINQLFHESRFPVGCCNLLVFIYFPVGVLLALVRFFISLHALIIAIILPKTWLLRRWVLRSMCCVLGIIVQQDGMANYEKNQSCVLVSNHTSIMDHLVVELLIPNYVVINKPSDSLLNWLLGYITLDTSVVQQQTPPGQLGTPLGQQNTQSGQQQTPPGQQSTQTGQQSTPPGQQNTQSGQPDTQPGHHDGQQQTPVGQERMKLKIQNFCQENSRTSLLIFPEQTSTNGCKGIMKFTDWPFDLGLPLQPLIISPSRPGIKLSVSVLNSHIFVDVFWHLFCPITFYDVKFLPRVERESMESAAEFGGRVQRMMARAGGLSATVYTSGDKAELIRRRLVDLQQRQRAGGRRQNPAAAFTSTTVASPRTSSSPRPSPTSSSPKERARSSDDAEESLLTMMRQVKDVLTDVPREVLRNDLSTTRNVDRTISRILEGVVPYTPEPSSPDTSASSTNKCPSPPTASVAFSRLPRQRELSLEERKQNLIDHCRARYLIKHGPTTTGNS